MKSDCGDHEIATVGIPRGVEGLCGQAIPETVLRCMNFVIESGTSARLGKRRRQQMKTGLAQVRGKAHREKVGAWKEFEQAKEILGIRIFREFFRSQKD